MVQIWRRKRLLLAALLCICVVIQICTSEPVFYEPFNESFVGRWIVSKKDGYTGVWKHSASEGHDDDFGLLVSEKARKYAIVKELDDAVSFKGKTVIFQFEVRFQEGLECGGSYLKYLRPQESGWKPTEFDSSSPYSIMFGPDKCGSTNKVHFIIQHENPKTGAYVEHHVKYPPSVPSDKLSHVYTAVVDEDGVRILVDGEEKKKAGFLSDEFEPTLVPAKVVPDPADEKPSDWDERTKIPDPDAEKPEDWNEDEPAEVEDGDAERPDGWLDDEPEEVDDPDAVRPEDWDDDEDGEWESPKVDNPKCASAPGCGPWKRPTKRNPNYKGKWYAPMIDNPDYRGVWKPRDVPNPDYFELDRPHLPDVSAVGIEIWTMQDGILFDSILITHDEDVAKFYRRNVWKPKYDAEKEKQKTEDSAAPETSVGRLSVVHKAVFGTFRKLAGHPLLASYRNKLEDLIVAAEKRPNVVVGVLLSILAVLVTILLRCVFAGEKPVVVPVVEEVNASEGEIDAGKAAASEDESSVAPRKRQSRRED